MAKAPDCGSKAIGFYAEYFPSERLIDIRVTVVAVRGAANRDAVLYVHIAPGEVLRLAPVTGVGDRVNQLGNLSEVIQWPRGYLHVVKDRGTVDVILVADNSIASALQVRPVLAGRYIHCCQVPHVESNPVHDDLDVSAIPG